MHIYSDLLIYSNLLIHSIVLVSLPPNYVNRTFNISDREVLPCDYLHLTSPTCPNHIPICYIFNKQCSTSLVFFYPAKIFDLYSSWEYSVSNLKLLFSFFSASFQTVSAFFRLTSTFSASFQTVSAFFRLTSILSRFVID